MDFFVLGGFMKRRFIFDIDGTLLNGNFQREIDYFRSVLSVEDSEKFIKVYFDLLMKYESKFKKYEVNKLSEFLKEESKTNITDEIIKGWIDVNSNMDDVINDGVIETLKYLKSKEKSLVVLTNWFLKTQKERLKNSGLLKYFDEIYAGDSILKPNRESYVAACGPYSVEECVIIGDDLQKDVYAPSTMGIDAIYYNPSNNYFQNTNKVLRIKNIKEIKERY